MLRRPQSFPLTALLLFAALLAFGLIKHSAREMKPSPLIGTELASFSLPLAADAGKEISSESFKNKITVINVFATWCIPCAMEHPAMLKLAAAKKANIIGIAWKDKPEKIAAWISEHGNPYNMLLLDKHGALTIPLGLTGIPETFIIDRHGTIVYNYQAAITEDMVDNDILPLIEKLQHE